VIKPKGDTFTVGELMAVLSQFNPDRLVGTSIEQMYGFVNPIQEVMLAATGHVCLDMGRHAPALTDEVEIKSIKPPEGG